MGCKKNMIKLSLVVFNIIAVIIGLSLLGIGAYSKYEYGEILAVSASTFTSIPSMMMILGVLVFILGFLGCFGSFKENRPLLIIYTILLVLVLMGEIVAIIISLIYKGKINDSVSEGLESKIESYIAYNNNTKNGDVDDKEIVDKIQETLECCGIHGTESYLEDEIWIATNNNETVPASCCSGVAAANDLCSIKKGNGANPALFGEGCLDLTTAKLSDNAGLVIGISIGFILIQIVGVVLGCVLCKRIARDGYKEV